MKPSISLLFLLALVACRRDTSSATPMESAPVQTSTDPAPQDEPAPATTPAPSSAGATDAEAPVADADEPAPEPSGPAKPIDDPTAGLEAAKDFAIVKLELKQTDGKVYKDTAGKTIDWATPTRIDVDFGGHKHSFVVTANRDGKANVSVQLDYAMDGTEVIRGVDVEAKLKGREVVRVEDGTAIAVTVANKHVVPKAAPKRETIDKPAGHDPLAGADK